MPLLFALWCCFVHLPCRPWWPSCSSPLAFFTRLNERKHLVASKRAEQRQEGKVLSMGYCHRKQQIYISARSMKTSFYKCRPVHCHFYYWPVLSLCTLLKKLYFITKRFDKIGLFRPLKVGGSWCSTSYIHSGGSPPFNCLVLHLYI